MFHREHIYFLLTKNVAFINPEEKIVLNFIGLRFYTKILLGFVALVLYPCSGFNKEILISYKQMLSLKYNTSGSDEMYYESLNHEIYNYALSELKLYEYLI